MSRVERRKRHRLASAKYCRRHPEKRHAHHRVFVEVRAGRLKKGPCEYAGMGCKGRLEFHHDDHARPLDVRVLCRRHHAIVEREARRRAA